MKKLFCTAISFTLFLTGWSENLTLEQCIDMAHDHYPAIAQYDIIDKAAGFNLSNAAKAWLPHGSISGQLTWQNDVASWPDKFASMLAAQGIDFPGIDKTQYKVGFDLNQQVWDGGVTSARKRGIETASDVERRSLDVQMYDVEGRVQDIYFGILLLDGRIKSVDNSIALVDSTLRQVKSMQRNGVAMQCDCDEIEAKLLGFQQQKTQLLASRKSYEHVLEIFIGQEVGDRDLELPDASPLSSDTRPQMQLFDAQLKNVTSQEDGIRASLMPQIGVFASGYYGYPGFNMFKSMQSHNPSFNFMAGLKLTWNFSSLYTRKNDMEKLQLQRRQIESNRETFLFNNSLAETEGDSQIEMLRKVMKNDEHIVQLRNSVVRAAQSQLRNGVIDATTLLSKITEAHLAENDLIIHNIELTKAIYKLNHIKNR